MSKVAHSILPLLQSQLSVLGCLDSKAWARGHHTSYSPPVLFWLSEQNYGWFMFCKLATYFWAEVPRICLCTSHLVISTTTNLVFHLSAFWQFVVLFYYIPSQKFSMSFFNTLCICSGGTGFRYGLLVWFCSWTRFDITFSLGLVLYILSTLARGWKRCMTKLSLIIGLHAPIVFSVTNT